MSKKGGYQIIDLKGVSLTSGSAVVIKGVYESIEGNYYKPLLLSGLVISDIEQTDAFISAISGTNLYTISLANGGSITITNEDKVTYTAPASSDSEESSMQTLRSTRKKVE